MLGFPAATLGANTQIVPPGNRHAEQPPIPGISRKRTQQRASSFEQKFQSTLAMINRDRALRRQIAEVASLYDIDSIHILGAIVGEHTYNYDILDTAQSYFMKALSYSGLPIAFTYKGENISEFIKRPELAQCRQAEDSATHWGCIETVWRKRFAGKTVAGKTFEPISLQRAFFRPLFAGQSFGIGQLTPLTALKADTITTRISGFSPLNLDQPKEIYRRVMDPQTSLHYTAATLKMAIRAYLRHANTDISKNPGITATLYNLGSPQMRAVAFAKRKRKSPSALPQENYYGWLVNDRIEDLEALLRR
ncbi:DUF1402 family protein [Polycladidibacter hongkongensis]|uniref:DUF1402 family protein n=1 Tax=Polycladidibacter hongkongensis TaxID=1647556 RepID=UPI000A7E444B|nr:DUF1402 family protein [Pseudovibrio hongkongensis]